MFFSGTGSSDCAIEGLTFEKPHTHVLFQLLLHYTVITFLLMSVPHFERQGDNEKLCIT